MRPVRLLLAAGLACLTLVSERHDVWWRRSAYER
jgi:hypothetical protein